MTDAVTLNITGRVQTTVVANIRQGSASTSAPVVRKLGAGSPLAVYAAVAGESVQGNPHWYLIGADQYVWAGACSPLSDGGQNFATNKSTPLPEASSTETGDATVTNFAGSGAPLSEAGVENAVAALNVTAPALWSVLSVETSGCGFL